MPSIRTVLLLASSLPLCTPLAAWADDGPAASDQTHGDHDDRGPEIVVTGSYPRDRADVLSGTSVLSGADLQREVRSTIGETLTRQPGVSATSFGPNASRPVLRGFQGERVRVLADGIGSFDVSNTSVDHAVVINPLTADRIEVLRGPAALQFGSSAIGGVVNVIDSRIPRSVPDEFIHVDATGTYGSAANERNAGARVDLPLGERFVVHFDGTYARSDDLRTGGFILTPALRAAAASGDPDTAALASLRGDLPNSAGRTTEIAGGAAFIDPGGSMGFSVSHYDSLYGVPVRYSVDPAVAAEQVRLDVHQTRLDWRGEIRPETGLFEAIKLRGGYADYRHAEIDDTGAVGTRFFNQGWEARAELVQRARGGWRGAVGGQFFFRDFNVIGDEKFLPRSETRQFGLFTLQSLDLGRARVEAGGRIERTVASAFADADLGNPDIRRTFTAYSGSLGGSYELVPGWRAGVNLSYSERAPSPEELFANGPHAGTQAFEIGNPAFTKERSTSVEATLRGKGEGYSLSASVYYSRFRGFIYDSPTGLIEDDLPVFQNLQADARYYGAEFEASVKLAQLGAFAISADALGDVTRAELTSGGSLPRIPALRVLGGLEAQSDRLSLRAEVERVARQNRVAPVETTTPGYTMVNASVNWTPFANRPGTSFTLAANNLFDVVARRHASFLKDFAPLAGRDIRLSARFSF